MQNNSPHEVLQKVYGYQNFIGLQEQVIAHVMSGKNALVLMPTGGGKSLCYQVPALCMHGTAVVVSPLIALMQDQVAALKDLGVRAAALNSALDFREVLDVQNALLRGELELLYVSPEKLSTPQFLELLKRTKISLFAIDEAHCISEWGHDFRPEYTQLSVLRDIFPAVPTLALTATADDVTRRDIIKHLRVPEADVFISSFDRPNIEYTVSFKDNEKKQLLYFIETKHKEDAGIVYCLSRKRVEETAEFLCEHGYNALPYHAGMDNALRAKNQNRFIKEESVIMVATNAFGLGINKPDVRFVAHMDLPKSMEAYYQETGRAGRDGLPSDAWLVYGLKDIVLLRQFIETSGAGDKQKLVSYSKLNSLIAYAESTQCRRQAILKYFAEAHPGNCQNCDTCFTKPATYDATVDVQKLLSCVYRAGKSGFNFGSGHIIDILRGKLSDKVRRFGHDKLSTFGIGAEKSAADWRAVVRQTVISGLAQMDMEHSTLQLTPASTAVLKGQKKLEFRAEVLRARKTKKEKKQIFVSEADAELLLKLKVLRRSLAEEENIPPYIVFSDKTLIDMASRRPQSLEEFALVNGVGQFKLQKYGSVFLREITAF